MFFSKPFAVQSDFSNQKLPSIPNHPRVETTLPQAQIAISIILSIPILLNLIKNGYLNGSSMTFQVINLFLVELFLVNHPDYQQKSSYTKSLTFRKPHLFLKKMRA